MNKYDQVIELMKKDLTNYNPDGLAPYFIFFARIIVAVLAVIIVYRCAKSLLRGKNESEEWGFLSLPNGGIIPIIHWENLIGRAKSCDIVLNYPTISRQHGAVIRDEKGNWEVYDLNSKSGITVNGNIVEGKCSISEGDKLVFGGIETVFSIVDEVETKKQMLTRTRPGREIKPSITIILLTLFQLFIALELCLTTKPEYTFEMAISFFGLIAITWFAFWFTLIIKRTGFEIETITFFLTTIGFSICGTTSPSSMLKQLVFVLAGILVFLVVVWILRDLNRAKKLRWPIAGIGIGILVFNLIFGTVVYGARNWVYIGGISFQPSEFVKIAFIFAGAATLERMFAKRNLIMFIGYAAACVGCLAIMADFGAALIFFVTFLVIAFMRSGDIATIALALAAAAFAAFLAIRFKPYIATRFATWGNAWSDPYDGGYQQTRTMSAAASGGLFGSGAGTGWLRYIAASETDLVFGIICEELGLIVALAAIASIIILAIFTVKSVSTSRSCFYITCSCAAVSIFIFQMILNVLGSVDIIPLTGVTFPFVSKGGSSLVSCFGLLAFIKASDTRQNASLAIRLRLKGIKRKEYNNPIEEPECDEDDSYIEDMGPQDEYDSRNYRPRVPRNSVGSSSISVDDGFEDEGNWEEDDNQ